MWPKHSRWALMVTNKYIYEYAQKSLGWLESRHRNLPLNFHDWQDFKQEAMIHIFQKKALLDPKLNFKPWVNTVIKRQFINHLRDKHYFGYGNRAKYEGRINKFTRPFQTKVVGGDVVMEPDIVQEDTLKSPMNDMRETINEITGKDRILIDEFLNEGNWSEIARKRGKCRCFCSKLKQRAVKRIKEQF